MPYRKVDPGALVAERGPHPAASPFDKRLTNELGLTAFEAYQVELPPGAETVPHNHLDDQVEDVYFVIQGSGWVVVDHEEVAVETGHAVAVTADSNRLVRAGTKGLALIAICGS